MIVVDIEASGIDNNKCGIWQIGAIEIENPENTFLEECRIEPEYEFVFEGNWVGKTVEETIGKTETELRDPKKQSEKQLLENFFKWVSNCGFRTFICQNPQFDLSFIDRKSRKYGLKLPTGYRAFDLHSIAFLRFFQVNNNILIKDNKSDMGLKNILPFVGLRDERRFHNALEDAKLTAEAFSRLVYGKNLLEEFNHFKIPDFLLKK
jgi:DNA polymerase III epsilon subunit-like protein